MAELVDALDLGSSDESRGGSSPSARTTLKIRPEVAGHIEKTTYKEARHHGDSTSAKTRRFET